jgi:hypothetical protein
MNRKVLGIDQDGWTSNWYACYTPEWQSRVRKVLRDHKCYRCNKSQSTLCSHCRYAYCSGCYEMHCKVIACANQSPASKVLAVYERDAPDIVINKLRCCLCYEIASYKCKQSKEYYCENCLNRRILADYNGDKVSDEIITNVVRRHMQEQKLKK